MGMFNVTWKKNAKGEVVGWREWLGRLEKVDEEVPQEVVDCFEFHGCDAVKTDGFFKVKPVFAPKPVDPLTEVAATLLAALLRK